MSISIALPPAPPAKTPLSRYRMLSPTASIRVSPLCLGSMNFGDGWKGYMGECNEETTESILDYFYSQGGNFIDTANNYQFEQAETRIGAWMKKRGVRDQMVIATKYSQNFHSGPRGEGEIMVNFTGNGSKSLHVSIKGSLEKLQTDYIDLLYVHWWDFSTSIPEVMQSLNHLVASGKVLHLGISDTPAWVVSKANEYARNHGLRQFSVYQGRWSASQRDFERDIIPMCRAEGMGLCPWGSLGGGKFKTEEQRNSTAGRKAPVSENDIKVSRVLESIANRKGTILTSVAQAYIASKVPYVFPIVGGRTLDHLKGNIDAVTLKLSNDEIKEIEAAIPFDVGFPNDMLYGNLTPDHPGHVRLLDAAGTFDYIPEPKSLSLE